MRVLAEATGIPEWTLGWRLQRSLDYGRVPVADMARELGVNRATVSRWMHDDSRPRLAYLKVWALRCGVSFEWLIGSGDYGRSSSHAGAGVRTGAMSSLKTTGPLGGRPGRRPGGRPGWSGGLGGGRRRITARDQMLTNRL